MAAIPVVAMTVAIAFFTVSETLGHTPFSLGSLRNIAEAAGLGSGPEVLRLLRQGEDPNQVLPVRGEIISSSLTRVTALEAAVWSRRVELVKLLDANGAIKGDESRHHLACIARDINAADILEYLAPTGAECVPEEHMNLVAKRTVTE